MPVAVDQNGVLAGKIPIAIAAARAHGLTLCSDGRLASWGENTFGQLGDNSTTDRMTPVEIDQDGVLRGKTVVTISASSTNNLALCSDGSLAMWGYKLGQISSLPPLARTTPEAVTQNGLLSNHAFLAVAKHSSLSAHNLATYAFPPEIAVEHPAEFNLPNGTATISFGTAPLVQGESERTFTIRNRTRGDLTVLGVTLDGTDSGDFTVTSHPEVQLSFGTSTTFTVRFKPTSLGEKTATLHIASNDGDENPFDITLTGTGIPGAHIRVGDTVTLDLSWVSLAGGETLKVSGLPPGLVLNAGAPPIITGTALGPVPNGGTIIQVLRSGKVVRTLPLNLVIDSHRLAGTYELLLEEGGQPSGKLSITVSNPNKAVPNPAFTATLERLGQSKRRAKGSFIASGSPQTVPIVFPSSDAASALTLNVVLTNGSDLASAVTQPASGLTARGFRLARTSRIPSGNPQITLTLPPTIPGDRVSTPGGIGHARGRVTSTALVSLAGQLGDAQPFTTSLSLSQTNQAVVWMTPYANKTSCIGGIINMADTGAADRRASAEMATTGLQWKKQADARAIAYPAGFGPLTLSVRCSRWVASVQAEGLAQSLALDFRALEAAYIAPTVDLLPARFSLRDNFTLLRIAPENAVPFTGKTTASIGTFSGIFTLPTPANRSPLSGVFLQDDTFNPLIGQGLVRIPVGGGVKGSYQTAGIEFRQPTSLGTHRYRIGDTVNLDLRASIMSGESLKILGLPPGLGQFGTVVTGTITGLGPSTGVKLQVFNGKTLVRTLPLDFAVEPYLLADSCELLLEDADAGLPVGKLKVTLSSPSAKQPIPEYSATLDFLGHPRRNSRGTFTPTGTPQVVRVDFPAYQSYSSGTFYLTFTAGSNQVKASTGRGFFVPIRVTGRGFRLARLGHIPTGNPTLTMTFPPVVPGNRTATPGGVGYAKGTISSQALIPLSGMLGDAQSFTTSLHLSQTNQAVVWLTPYQNKSSYFGGIIDIAVPATPDRGAVLGAHTAGVTWARLADASAPSYPAGFSALSLTAKSSRWVPAKTATVLADSLGLTFRGINASYIAPTTDLLPNFWSLRDNSSLLRIAPTNAVPFTGKALGTNGTFNGNLTLPTPVAKSAMSGVFLQDATFGQAIGQGLIKVPITAPVKGSFQTFGVELRN